MDLEELSRLVEQVARAGPVGQALERVELDPEIDNDGEQFIRVRLFVRLPAADVDDQLEATLEQIESAVAAVDERYASVRFLDAA